MFTVSVSSFNRSAPYVSFGSRFDSSNSVFEKSAGLSFSILYMWSFEKEVLSWIARIVCFSFERMLNLSLIVVLESVDKLWSVWRYEE